MGQTGDPTWRSKGISLPDSPFGWPRHGTCSFPSKGLPGSTSGPLESSILGKYKFSMGETPCVLTVEDSSCVPGRNATRSHVLEFRPPQESETQALYRHHGCEPSKGPTAWSDELVPMVGAPSSSRSQGSEGKGVHSWERHGQPHLCTCLFCRWKRRAQK